MLNLVSSFSFEDRIFSWPHPDLINSLKNH